MVKVDVALLKELQELAFSISAFAFRATTKYGMFCDECGEVSPECGFYPLRGFGPHSVSGLTCIDCEAKQRREVQSKKKEETNGEV